MLAATTSGVAAAGMADYSDGIFFVNEDWYGHRNSSVNFLLPDDPEGNYWYYRVIREENPGMELGCTCQFAALWNGRMYVIAKQDKDPGAEITGGRITVADAATMKILHQQRLIDPSGAPCDGRGFVGIDSHKGYISSTNGVWIFDLDSFSVLRRVEGSGNPDAAAGGLNSIYRGQTGTMVLAAGRVFAAHQQLGVLVIDPVLDVVTATIPLDFVSEGAGVGSIVKASDGSLWLSVAKDTRGSGATLNALVRLDPQSLETEVVNLPEGIDGPPNSWYSWNPDAFTASAVRDLLFWKGSAGRWAPATKVYCFDVVSRNTRLFVDLEEEGANWKLYGCSLGVHPVTDEVYMSLYHDTSNPNYVVRRFSPLGEPLRDYPMIANYWFPSIPVFAVPDRVGASLESVVTEAFMTLENGTLSLSGALPGCWLELYSVSGVLVARQPVPVSGELSLDLSRALPGALYIARCGSLVRKFSLP